MEKPIKQSKNMEKIDLIVDLSSLEYDERGNYKILAEPSARQNFIIGSTITIGNQYENQVAVIIEKTFSEQGLHLLVKKKY